MDGVWITGLDTVSFKYGNPNVEPLKVNAKFKMQYYYRDDDLDLTMDPLSHAKILAAYA